jgi:DinB superfamily
MRETTRIDDLLVRLAAIPTRVASAVAEGSKLRLHPPSVVGEWSTAEIFAHMRASDDIMSPRAYMILVRDQPPLAAYDDRRWAEVAGYAQADFQTLLQAFTLRRAELVSMLGCIAPEEWRRVGVHEAHGPVSLLDVITTLVEHEEEHCTQLER